jgi:hypothetical protein
MVILGVHDDHEVRDFENAGLNNDQFDGSSPFVVESNRPDQPQVDETSPLVEDYESSNHGRRTTEFGTVNRNSIASLSRLIANELMMANDQKPYGHEQLWSAKLPTWLWFLQFLLIGPLFLLLIAEPGLRLVALVNKNSVDGADPIHGYLLIAAFSILLVLPLTPFLHRTKHHFSLVVSIICAATMTFNLIVFPFNDTIKYGMYFSQEVYVENRTSLICFMGEERYVRQALARLPTAMGEEIVCEPKSSGLATCTFDGSAVVPEIDEKEPHEWIRFNPSREGKLLHLVIDAAETRKCSLAFSRPVTSFQVEGSDGTVLEQELDGITLYRRQWDMPWVVDFITDSTQELEMEVICEWADSHHLPILEEAARFLPDWVTVISLHKSLLHARRTYRI